MRWRGNHTPINGLNRPKSREMAGDPDTCADGRRPAHCAKHPIRNGRQSLSVLALSPETGGPRPLKSGDEPEGICCARRSATPKLVRVQAFGAEDTWTGAIRHISC